MPSLKQYYLLPLLFFAVSTQAQPSADSVRYELPTTIIHATRSKHLASDLPFALSVIEADTLAAPLAGISLQEVLRRVPGIHVDNRHNLSQGDRLSARGLGVRAAFGVRGLKVVLDGIPLTTADGQTQLNNLDLGSLGRIEILRGPSSALYGNASGGLLSIYTRQASSAFLRLQPRLLMGSDGLWRAQGRLSGSSGKHRYFLSFQGLRADGYRHHAYAYSRGLNALSHHDLNERLELGLLFNIHDAPYLFNPSSLDRQTASSAPRSARFFIVSQGAAKKVRQAQGGASLRYSHAQGSTSQLVVYGLDRSLKNPIPGRIIELERGGGGVRATHSGAFNKLRFTGGIDLDWQSDQRGEFANEGLPDAAVGTLDDERVFSQVQYGAEQLDQREKVRSVGHFLSLEMPIAPALALSLSGRYDRYHFAVKDHLALDGDDSGTRNMSQFSPLLGLSYHPHTQFMLYANFATAFQTPTTTELSNRADGRGGFNPDLDPEKIRSVELGTRLHHPHWPLDVELSLYQLDIRDMLLPFQVDDPLSEEIYFRNAGKTQNRGLELALSARPAARLEAHLAYTYSHFRFVDYVLNNAQLKNNEVPGQPPHHLFGELRYYARKNIYTSLELEWVSDYFANDFNGPRPGSEGARSDFVNDASFRADLRLGWRPGPWQFFAGIDNLLDTTYNGSIVPNAFGNRFFEPAAGRTAYAGIEWDLVWHH